MVYNILLNTINLIVKYFYTNFRLYPARKIKFILMPNAGPLCEGLVEKNLNSGCFSPSTSNGGNNKLTLMPVNNIGGLTV